MTLMQAILIGMIYYLYSCEFICGFCHSVWYYPMTSCFWVGLILGDMPTALMCGGLIQPLFLAFSAAGGVVPTDKCAAGLIPTAAVIVSGMDINAAIALSVPVGLLTAQLHTIRRLMGSVWVHMGDKLAEKETIKTSSFFIVGWLLPSLWKIINFWIPMTLILYFGTSGLTGLMDSIPAFLSNGLAAVGAIMPALGMGMTICVIGRREFLPYFFAGFFLVQFTGLGNIALALVGAFLAFLYLQNNKEEVVDDEEEDEEVEIMIKEEERVLTKKDVYKAYFYWIAGCEMANSFERLQALGFCITMLPALQKLYKGRNDELHAAVKRHLQFFNTENFWGAIIPGIVLAMEEQKSLGYPITEEAITGVKTGLMGPFAGIGDTIDWATLCPLILAFFVPYVAQGHVWASIAPMVLIGGIFVLEGLYFFPLGYRMGTKAATSLLESGSVKKIITFFSILGLFMIGGLSASFVVVTTPLAIPNADTMMSVQTDILDAILPGMLSLGAIMAVYFYLKKHNNAVMRCTLYIIVIGLILGGIGIIG